MKKTKDIKVNVPCRFYGGCAKTEIQMQIYVIKKRGFVQPIEVMPEMVELISAGIAVIHTDDAYYVVSITGANEPPVIFFSYSQPEIGRKLVGDEIICSKHELDVRHKETVTDEIINILQVTDVSVCYTYNKVYLVTLSE